MGNLSSVGGHACKVFGQLEVIDTDQGEAAELWGDDDRDDGLKLQVLNPLAQPVAGLSLSPPRLSSRCTPGAAGADGWRIMHDHSSAEKSDADADARGGGAAAVLSSSSSSPKL